MGNALVQLKHSSINGGDPVQVYCTSVSVNHNKNNSRVPNANYTAYPVDVQTESRENVKYILNNVKLGIGGIAYKRLIDFFSLQNDSSDPIYLNVTFGNSKMIADFGSIAYGSTHLYVDNLDAYSIGDIITVEGMGSGGTDLTTTVTGIITFLDEYLVLDDAALSPVTNGAIYCHDGERLTDSSFTTTDIPVTFDGGLSINIDVADSNEGYRPGLSITLLETKTS